MMEKPLQKAADLIQKSEHFIAFTGAGISVESGIPSFRGENGLWTTYDPSCLDINYFLKNPKEAWQTIKAIFYDGYGKAQPNQAHLILASLETKGLLHAVITQNIDTLHQKAGSKTVYEFHGSIQYLRCPKCGSRFNIEDMVLNEIPPLCQRCTFILKPDFVFFGEMIPEGVQSISFLEAETADVVLVIGTTGEVHPAALIPQLAKRNGAAIIEINTVPSRFTAEITDVFLSGKASEVMTLLIEAL